MLLAGAYLLGSIPFSYLFPKIKGKNVQEGGTKNVGATNALVVAGPLFGALAWIGDVGKGYLAVYLAQMFIGTPWALTLAGIFAVIGHDFSIFLRFKGGKGVATTAGVFFAFDPLFTVVITILWVFFIVVSRYFIASTLVLLGLIPLLMRILGMRLEVIVFSILAFLLACYTHRNDVKRLLAGEEIRADVAIRKFLK
ncbi:MAG: glycerol-3-phosphate 1-O-acyltransferase PlsY [bacterium]